LEKLNHELSDRFGISHATIQFERQIAAHGCPSEKEF
jgi:Co/Zn/Cd efflux system component